jgi:hypothetical protein
MFLFEGPFGAVLHTGDCRLTPDCLSALMPFLARRIDYLFLDCTFARCPLPFPTKEDSIRQVSSLSVLADCNTTRASILSGYAMNRIPFLC